MLAILIGKARPHRRCKAWELRRGCTFEESLRQKKVLDCGNLHMLQMVPKSSACAVSIRHGNKIGPKVVNFGGQQGPNFGQFGSKMAQLGPNIDLLGNKFGIWLQNGEHSWPNPKSSRRPFSLVFFTFFCIDAVWAPTRNTN